MVSTEAIFNELGIDAITGVEIMDWIGVTPIDFSDPARFMRFHQIIDYFKGFPIDTQRFIIRKITNGKNVDKLNYVWEYTELLKNKRAAEEALDNVRKEQSALGTTPDPLISQNLAIREAEAKQALEAIINEAAIYEK